MAGPVARVGLDRAGPGVILGPGAPTVFVNGMPTSVIGDLVTPHGSPPHKQAVITTASPTVFANGKPVTRLGSIATCMHPVTSSSNVFSS